MWWLIGSMPFWGSGIAFLVFANILFERNSFRHDYGFLVLVGLAIILLSIAATMVNQW